MLRNVVSVSIAGVKDGTHLVSIRVMTQSSSQVLSFICVLFHYWNELLW